MANTYFEFKRFTIHQDQCAMKVCTDACILGGWLANSPSPEGPVLDIGSGTGILMLMLAQKWDGNIDGIEIDPLAYGQLLENLKTSQWSNRLQAYLGDVRFFDFRNKYKFIVSNPPFYEHDLLSPNHQRNLAKHSRQLSLSELLQSINRNLAPDGTFAVLLPSSRITEWRTIAKHNGYFPLRTLEIRQSDLGPYSRIVEEYANRSSELPITSELTIHTSDGLYSKQFIDLMKDYYLLL